MARAEAAPMRVSVAYAGPDRVRLVEVEVAPGATVGQALRASGLLEACPDIDLRVNRVGIFNEECTLETRVAPGDRIEIYRPLRADPKEARRRRAAART